MLKLFVEYTQFIEVTLRKASDVANKSFGKVIGTTKSDNSIVTKTDFEIGQLIISDIKKYYPDYNIIDEEAGVINKNSEFTWVIDPIDGTSNFALGIPLYGIFLGLLKNDKPIAGGIVLPFFNEIIIAQKGQGAFCNGIPLKLNQENNLMNTLIAYGFNHYKDQPEKIVEEFNIVTKILSGVRNIRTSNSAYDIVQVIKGKYGAILGQASKIWDHVACQAIMEEIGYKYTDYFGKEIDYSDAFTNSQKNISYCVAPPILFDKIQKLIHQ